VVICINPREIFRPSATIFAGGRTGQWGLKGIGPRPPFAGPGILRLPRHISGKIVAAIFPIAEQQVFGPQRLAQIDLKGDIFDLANAPVAQGIPFKANRAFVG
jgi:hypothetical protein